MRDFGDHAANGGRVVDARAPPDLVEAETLERGALILRPANATAELLESDRGLRIHARSSLKNPGRRLRRPGGATAASTPSCCVAARPTADCPRARARRKWRGSYYTGWTSPGSWRRRRVRPAIRTRRASDRPR